MRILMDDESCDILENSSLLLERIKEDYLVNQHDFNSKKKHTDTKQSKVALRSPATSSAQKSLGKSSSRKTIVTVEPKIEPKQPQHSNFEAQIRDICDEVIGDSIGNCNEPDYKMELAKLLSGEAKIELYIKDGKLSNAQRLACNMNRPDYVINIIEEAERLNQNHVKTVCQLWLAKHETKNSMK